MCEHAPDVKSHTELADWRDVAAVTATHCCVCNRKLTDAESVENGIGPVCSKRYYNPAQVPSSYQVAVAMGELVATTLPDRIQGAVIDRKSRARQACNILVYWASAHYDDRDIVLECARVIRAFGYVELSDRLEDDRTTLSLRTGKLRDEDTEDRIIILFKKKNWEVFGKLKAWCEGREEKRKGSRQRWTVPMSQRIKVEAILGYYYGGTLGCIESGFYNRERSGVDKIPKRSWDAVLVLDPAYEPATVKPATQGDVRIVPMREGGFEFYSPYNATWLADMKNAIPWKRRRWMGNCWTFAPEQLRMVKDLAATHYGVTL